MDEDEDEEEEQEMKIDTLLEKGNERATEIFVDSGILKALEGIKNVQKFDINFGFSHRDEDELYEPKPEHLELFKEMKEKIEGNFKG